jgi:hypothetical protein
MLAGLLTPLKAASLFQSGSAHQVVEQRRMSSQQPWAQSSGGSGVRRHSAALPAEPLSSAAHVRHSVLPTKEARSAVAQELTSMMNAPAASGWGWPCTAAMEEAEARVPSLPPGTLPEVQCWAAHQQPGLPGTRGHAPSLPLKQYEVML